MHYLLIIEEIQNLKIPIWNNFLIWNSSSESHQETGSLAGPSTIIVRYRLEISVTKLDTGAPGTGDQWPGHPGH